MFEILSFITVTLWTSRHHEVSRVHPVSVYDAIVPVGVLIASG